MNHATTASSSKSISNYLMVQPALHRAGTKKCTGLKTGAFFLHKTKHTHTIGVSFFTYCLLWDEFSTALGVSPCKRRLMLTHSLTCSAMFAGTGNS